MLDIGLSNIAHGLSLHQLSTLDEINLLNSGFIAEAYTGQSLRTLFPAYVSPSLYYWQQTKKIPRQK